MYSKNRTNKETKQVDDFSGLTLSEFEKLTGKSREQWDYELAAKVARAMPSNLPAHQLAGWLSEYLHEYYSQADIRRLIDWIDDNLQGRLFSELESEC